MDRKQIEHLLDTAQERADAHLKQWSNQPKIKVRRRADAERARAWLAWYDRMREQD